MDEGVESFTRIAHPRMITRISDNMAACKFQRNRLSSLIEAPDRAECSLVAASKPRGCVSTFSLLR